MDQRDEQSLQVAKLYHRGGMSQGEVAVEMGLSRPTVAKLLQHAKARGFVTVEIHDPREDGDEFGQRYTVAFKLKWKDRSATVRSGWTIEPSSGVPRLTTCYPL